MVPERFLGCAGGKPVQIPDSRAGFQVLSSPGCVEFMLLSDFKSDGVGKRVPSPWNSLGASRENWEVSLCPTADCWPVTSLPHTAQAGRSQTSRISERTCHFIHPPRFTQKDYCSHDIHMLVQDHMNQQPKVGNWHMAASLGSFPGFSGWGENEEQKIEWKTWSLQNENKRKF